MFKRKNKDNRQVLIFNANKMSNNLHGGGGHLNNNPNKKHSKLKVITLVLLGMLIIVGTSYAAFDFSFTGEENEISTSDISLKLLESNNEIINVENMLPMSDNEGIEQIGTGNVFDFAVETKASSNVNIGYKINIEKLSLDTGYTSFTDDEIKVYLTDTNDNKILGPVKISELSNYNLYEDMNIHNKDNKVQTDKYRIRVWVDKDVDASSWDENTKLGYKFKIGVSSLEEQGKYNISYSPNGGEGVMATSVYNENTQERLRKNTFTRGGYTFKGWSTNTSGEVEYQDKGVATNLTTSSSDKNKTLYALWKPHNYTVKYNANGGGLYWFPLNETLYPWENNNGVYRSSNYNVDSSTSTMISNEFTLTEAGEISFDWAVSGGYVDIEALDPLTAYLYYTIYKDGEALSDTGKDTLIYGYGSSDTEDTLTYTTVTKTLEAGTYRIAFTYRHNYGNTGLNRGYVKNITIPDHSDTMESSNFTVGENNKLSKNVYTKSHYTFKGWHTNKNETNIKYQDEASLGDLEKTVKENDEINLYAIYEIDKFNVNVVVQNGTITDNTNKQIEYNKEVVFSGLKANDRYGSSTVSCTNNQTGIVKDDALIVSNVTSDTTCTVIYKIEYTVKYNANGGFMSNSPTFPFNEEAYPWENNNGVYRSSNYNVDSSTSTMTSNEFTLTETGEISFDWAVSSESKSYDYLYYTIYKNGTALSGTGTSTKIGGYKSSDTESNLTYTSVTKTLESGTYKIAFTYTKDSSQHKGLDRGYVKNIIIPGYDESKAMDNSNFTVGQNNKLSKNKYLKTGYTFKGWSENNNATTATYQDEGSLEDLEKKVKNNDVLNLYAIWEINKYTVNVIVQNGTVDEATKQTPYNTNGAFKLTPNSTELIGTVSCTNNQTGTLENNVLIVSNVTSDTTCTVIYKIEYTVKYNANGGFMSNSPTFPFNEEAYPWENNNGVYRSSNYNVDSSTSIMTSNEFTLTETGEISFDWAVSSESKSYDYLYYTIYKNGTALSGTGTSTKIGGYTSSDTESNLTYTSVTKILEAGTYKIAFTYRKDDSTHKGLDRGYVKNIIIPGYDESKAMDNSNFTVGQNNKLSKNKYVKLHYTFKGWSENNNATTATYQDEGSLEDLEKKVKNNDVLNLYAIWEINKYTVNVVVQNGTVDEATKQTPYNTNGTFNLTPTVEGAIGTVTCINNQNGIVENNVLTVENVTSDTTCTVKFVDTFTTLYEDGTLIINESISNRSSNLDTHGTITKEYEPMSDSNSYALTSYNGQPWKNEREQITNVEIGQEISPISTAYWFYDLTNMKEGDFTNLDTSSVTDMNWMFNTTGHNANTFSLDLSNWDTSSVTDMSSMFSSAGYSASTWSVGDLSGWDTSNVTDMGGMFDGAGYSASTWSVGDLSGWDTSSVTSMSYMFNETGYSASTWSVGNLSNWDTSSVTGMYGMFDGAGYSATTFNLDLSGWDTSSVTSMSYMFNEAGRSATTWSVGNLSNWNTHSVKYMIWMFNEAGVRATTWNIGDLSGWDTSSVTSMSYMFNETGYSATTWNIGDLSEWDTSSVTDMSYMFSGAGRSATTFNLDLSGWDTSKVTNMLLMFSYAGYSATTFSLDLSNWVISKAIGEAEMFYEAGRSATTFVLDLSGWDTSSVTSMKKMFYCVGYSATTFNLDLSGWDTSSVTNMNSMFLVAGESAATFNLDLSGWDTSSVTDMSNMFSNAGRNATTWSVTIPSTTGSLINTTSKLYGSSSSVYASPSSGKSFTLAS